MTNGTPPDIEQLKPALEHARALFIYHAGQRLTAIYYFFVAYAVAAGAYIGLLEKTASPGTRLMLGFYAIFITAVFWCLDWRNAQLVRIDENAMHELEKKVSGVLTLSEKFLLAENWDKQATWLQYKNIIPTMFSIMVALPALVVLHALYTLCEAASH